MVVVSGVLTDVLFQSHVAMMVPYEETVALFAENFAVAVVVADLSFYVFFSMDLYHSQCTASLNVHHRRTGLD